MKVNHVGNLPNFFKFMLVKLKKYVQSIVKVEDVYDIMHVS